MEYQTYETFERDPVKYERYGRAIYLALMDGMRMGRYPFLGSTGESSATSIDVADSYMDGRHDDDDDDEDECDDNDIDGKGGVVIDVHRVTILVVGAGRGPLVREAVSAVARASASLARPGRHGRGGCNRRKRALRANIVAIEKNPSAVLYLRGLKCIDPSWNGGRDYDPCADDGADGGGGGGSDIAVPGTSVVTVVGCDMREASSDPLLGRMNLYLAVSRSQRQWQHNNQLQKGENNRGSKSGSGSGSGSGRQRRRQGQRQGQRRGQRQG